MSALFVLLTLVLLWEPLVSSAEGRSGEHFLSSFSIFRYSDFDKRQLSDFQK